MSVNALAGFKVERVLSNNTNRKTIAVLGKYTTTTTGDDQPDQVKEEPAILVLEKKAFQDEDLTAGRYTAAVTGTEEQFVNDIYGNYELTPGGDFNKVKTTIIRPCTEDHIRKYAVQEVFLVQETPELYRAVTLVNLEQRLRFSLDWVYNILDHKKEVDRIVYEDPDDTLGFVLLPDLKWDGKTQETLYCLAIVRQRGIKSLRDLTATHLPLLENILEKGKQAIQDKYGVAGNQLRIYLHYQPTFYHLHVHFTYLKHEAPGIYCEKSHLLETVIDNIRLLSDYYARATLPFVIKEGDSMWQQFKEAATDNGDQGCKRIKTGGDDD